MRDFDKWRVGYQTHRTIYRDEVLVGMFDSAEVAREVIEALNREPAKLPLDAGREGVLVDAIARIAQIACRNGESGGRTWRPLTELPFYESWRCVGETYAPSLRIALRAIDIAEATVPGTTEVKP